MIIKNNTLTFNGYVSRERNGGFSITNLKID